MSKNSASRISGKFIVFEGLDGSDSFNQAASLVSYLKNERGIGRIHLTRQPSDGPVGSAIRLRLQKRLDLDDLSLAAFFAADRMDHLFKSKTGIVPRLDSGEFVVCDRYYISSFAYQTLNPAIDIDWLGQLNAQCRRPDITFFLDIPIENCIQTIISERLYGVHFSMFEPEQENIQLLKDSLNQVRENYYKVIVQRQKDGEHIEIISKSTPQECRREIEALVTKSLF